MTGAESYRRARHDPALVVLEGFHPLKHALRFGAELLAVAALDPGRLRELAERLAPDLVERLPAAITEVVGPEALARRVPRVPRTGVVAIARRPVVDVDAALAAPGRSAAVALFEPRHAGNLGAAVRVAAAAGAAGLVAVGGRDPWEPAAVRGGAGLQFALPVARAATLPVSDRPLVALDPRGEPLTPGILPARALLAFGTERHGLAPALLSRADRIVSIPMREGVSSLNLATAVAITLYAVYR